MSDQKDWLDNLGERLALWAAKPDPKDAKKAAWLHCLVWLGMPAAEQVWELERIHSMGQTARKGTS